MKLLKAQATNFGSYDLIEFSFDSIGLALVHGATGAGKSTLQDIPSWILFGQTAKNGNVDDIRSWTHPDEPTTGILQIALPMSTILVTRVRGKPSQNDLYWCEEGLDTKHRGKDIIETQKSLNALLGVDHYLYTMASYYNEFSPTGGFFTAKASDRRELFENLANLEFPITLAERVTNEKKQIRQTFSETLENYNKVRGKYEQLTKTEATLKRHVEQWKETQARTLEDYKTKSQKFDQEKQTKIENVRVKIKQFEVNKESNLSDRLNSLESLTATNTGEVGTCTVCGQKNEAYHSHKLQIQRLQLEISHIKTSINPHINELPIVESQQNTYEDRFNAESGKENPFIAQQVNLAADIQATNLLQSKLKIKLDGLDYRKNALNQLQILLGDLRSLLVGNTITMIQSEVNRYLETYFDSEIKVMFSLGSSDDLDIKIWKSGHECAYRQLSKGQKSLLKLTFSVAAMKAASNKAGVNFETLMFDESLDGMDSALKLKAFNLFTELSLNHPSVLVIDHNEELKTLFNKIYYVTINSDTSSIIEE